MKTRDKLMVQCQHLGIKTHEKMPIAKMQDLIDAQHQVNNFNLNYKVGDKFKLLELANNVSSAIDVILIQPAFNHNGVPCAYLQRADDGLSLQTRCIAYEFLIPKV